jgi:hypothetical protein
VPKRFTKRQLRQRIVALVLAYAVALSGLIGGLGAARATVAASAGTGLVTCHSETAGQQTPGGDKQSGAICDGSCCIGCLLLVAALPPPPAIAVAVVQSTGRALPLLAVGGFTLIPQTRSHQSRGPPIAV